MTASSNFENMVSQILTAHNERDMYLSALHDNTTQFLNQLSGNRARAAETLRFHLNTFSNNLRQQDKGRRSQFYASYMAGLRSLSNQRRQNGANNLKDLQAHRYQNQSMRASHRRAYRFKRRQNLFAFLSDLSTERKMRAQAWQQLIETLKKGQETQTEKKSIAQPEQSSYIQSTEQAYIIPQTQEKQSPTSAEDQSLPSTEHIEPAARPTETYDISELKQRIIDELSTHPDGARMVQLAEKLEIEQWRLLIPVMREMQDAGAIRKEGSVYFRG